MGDARASPVVFITYYYSPYVSGLTVHIRNLAEGLVRRGHEVGVVCARHDDRLPSHEVINGVDVLRVPVLASASKGVVAPMLVPTAAGHAGADGVLIPVLPLLEAGLVAAWPRRHTLPFYICDLRLDDALVGRVAERLSRASARLAVRRAPLAFASSIEYAAASRVIGDLPTPIVASPPPIDFERFHPADSTDLRERLGLTGRRCVGFVGRLVPEKGIDVLIRAFRQLGPSFADVSLVIAGEGKAVPGGGLHEQIARDVGNDERIIVTGFLDDGDLPDFYSMLDVLALPSVDPLEAYGMVQVEAMLCGTPVVASDMPGVRIPVTRTGMGELAGRGDDASLAVSLRRVLDNRARYVMDRAVIRRELDPDEGIEAVDRCLRLITQRDDGPAR